MYDQQPQPEDRPPTEIEQTGDQESHSLKQPYEPPLLRCFGSVPAITLGRGGSGNDAGGNPSQRRPRNIFSAPCQRAAIARMA